MILVWFFNIRPFSNIIPILDSIFNAGLALKIKENQLTPAALAAIDIALLTFLLNALIDLVKKIFKRPLKVTVKIKDKHFDNFTTLTFQKEAGEKTFSTNVSVKIEAKLEYGLFIFKNIFRGVRLTFFWHPDFLSIEHGFTDHTKIMNIEIEPGNIHCNLLPLFSESDKDFDFENKLYVMVNNHIKKSGQISAKVQINSNNAFWRFMFNWAINMLVKTEITPFKIHIRSED